MLRSHERSPARTRLSDVKNFPIRVDMEKMTSREVTKFYDSDKAPSATLEVKVTDPIWLQHIRHGMRFETSAFDLTARD
jgi:hypothetical protein